MHSCMWHLTGVRILRCRLPESSAGPPRLSSLRVGLVTPAQPARFAAHLLPTSQPSKALWALRGVRGDAGMPAPGQTAAAVRAAGGSVFPD